MNILRRGSEGPQVEQLQTRLNEIYEEQLEVDGIFGYQTEETVADFQRTNEIVDLDVDGIVGPATWQALFEEPQEEGEEPEEPFPPPGEIIYQSQLTALFGKPRDPAPYLKIIDLAEFKDHFTHVKDYLGHPWSCQVYGHQLLEAPLRQAFKLLVERGFSLEMLTYDGCVCVRPMTSGNGWSVHAWGLALDFNAARNAYGRTPSLSAGFVRCFTDVGFEWGGRWSTPDGMHFQLPHTR